MIHLITNLFAKKKLVHIVTGTIVWVDRHDERQSYAYHLYEKGTARSFKAIGFEYPHMITKMHEYVNIVAPWLDGCSFESLKHKL